MNIQQLVAEVGIRTRGISLMFDLINACSFRCPSCPVGNVGLRSGAMMSLGTFQQILDRVGSQLFRIRYILLYSFSEPYLHPRLPEIVAECKRRGIWTMASTNLSRPDNIEATMLAGLDELRISFSGFEKGEYFHTGRSMAQFRDAADHVARLIPNYKTRVGLIWHIYRTNEHERPVVEAFAKKHGFELIPETAFFIPYEKIVANNYTVQDKELISHLKQPPWEAIRNVKRQEFCYYQQKQIVIDAKGKVFLCRHMYDEAYIVGDILEDRLVDIRERMWRHPFCQLCKGCGLNKYTP